MIEQQENYPTPAVAHDAIRKAFVWQRLKKPLIVVGLLVVVVAGSLAIQSIGTNKTLLPGVTLFKSDDESSKRGDQGVTRLPFSLLMNWKYIEDQTPIPDEILKYNGKYVEISGYLLPYGGSDEEPEYMLFESMFSCCFGQAPEINHIVLVKLRGKRIEDFSGIVSVRGIFKAGELREDGFLVALYQIQADRVVSK